MDPRLKSNLDDAIGHVSTPFNQLRDALWRGDIEHARKLSITLNIALTAAAWYVEDGRSCAKKAKKYFQQHLADNLT